MTTFTVIRDGADFMVADASVAAKSFAMVPADRPFMFDMSLEARRAAIALNQGNQEIPLRMIETPDRFEEVADKIYGPAWE